MTTTTEEFYQDIETFDDLDISEDLLRGIYGFGFEIPSAIQRKAILPIIKKRDIIAQAQSGTGKTASFLIGSMARVDKSLNEVQVIIICPNRELANQIKFNFDAFNTY